MGYNGKDLRSERLRKGLELQTLSERTGIRIGVLQALEAGRHDEVGSSFTAQSMLRACYLALRSDPDKSTGNVNSFPEARNRASENLQERLGRTQNRLKRWRAFALFLTGLILLGSLAVVFWIVETSKKVAVSQQKVVSEKAASAEERAPSKPLVSSPPLPIQKEHTSPAVNGSANRSETTGQSEQQTAVPQIKEEIPPQIQESQQRNDLKSQNTSNKLDLFINGADFREKRMLSVKRKEKSGPHTLNVKAIAECWIQFKIDGGKRRSELLHPGELRSWEVSKDAQLTIGNAGGILIEWDGKTLGPGKSGRVLRINLPKELSQSNAKDQKLGR